MLENLGPVLPFEEILSRFGHFRPPSGNTCLGESEPFFTIRGTLFCSDTKMKHINYKADGM